MQQMHTSVTIFLANATSRGCGTRGKTQLPETICIVLLFPIEVHDITREILSRFLFLSHDSIRDVRIEKHKCDQINQNQYLHRLNIN